MEFIITLPSIDDAVRFVEVANRYKADINVSRDKLLIDAKSLMGMFSLPRMDGLVVSIITDDKEEFVQLKNDCSKWLAEQH